MQQDERELDLIVSNPAVLDGQPCVAGTRLTVKRVLTMLATLRTPEAIAEGYPQLTEEAVRQVLAYAAACVDDKVVALRLVS